jgi:tRNA(Arg) A34 adenosine deaminase TadA
MCLGAIYWARLSRITYGCTHEDAAAAGFDDSFIYAQFRIPASERSIPMAALMREEALDCFREWERKTDRIAY